MKSVKSKIRRYGLIGCLLLAAGLVGIVQARTVNAYRRYYHGIEITEGTDTYPRLQRAWAARINLYHPDVSLTTTPGNGGAPYETTRQTTPGFLDQYNTKLAVNANFYSAYGSYADNWGLLIRNGQIISNAQSGTFSAQLRFTAGKVASLVASGSNPSGIYTAIGGAEIILDDGVNIGTNPDVQPRTVMGLSEDRKYLIIVVIDGRQPGWSEGVNHYEAAEWLLDFGAWDGCIFDGGGSTCMVRDKNGNPEVINHPSDGSPRAVGANFGIYSQNIYYQNARPVIVRAPNHWLYRNSLSSGQAEDDFYFGTDGDFFITGDWDGNGSITPGIVRVNDEGKLEWYLKNSMSGGSADVEPFVYGLEGDAPVAGDWDDTRTWTPGVVRDNVWYLRNSNSSGSADIEPFSFGASDDFFVVGDWDNNGTFTIGVVRGNQWYLRNTNSAGPHDHSFSFGKSTDFPIVGDWDGDGDWTCGVVRGNVWYYCNTLGGSASSFGFGSSTDLPLVWH